MTEQSTTADNPTATIDTNQQRATGSDMTSSSSRGIEFYFQWAVVVIGVVGTATNVLILYALVASKQHKKHVLIFHQNVLDLCSSFLLTITYLLKLCNFYLSGSPGYWLCVLILSENLVWSVIIASNVNLMIVTIDRYLKVVHSVWSKKTLRKWMIYSAMAFAWISGLVTSFPTTFTTSDVIGGVCFALMVWKSRVAQMAFGIWYFMFDCLILLILFIFCYWRILVVIRRQSKVMATHSGPGPSTAQTQSHQMKTSVIKTMILVSVFHTISSLPLNIYYLLLNINANLSLLDGGYYALVFTSFLYFSSNPFIYATKFDPVKRILLDLIPCVKTPVQPIESIEIASHRRATVKVETRN